MPRQILCKGIALDKGEGKRILYLQNTFFVILGTYIGNWGLYVYLTLFPYPFFNYKRKYVFLNTDNINDNDRHIEDNIRRHIIQPRFH